MLKPNKNSLDQFSIYATGGHLQLKLINGFACKFIQILKSFSINGKHVVCR